MEDIIVGKPEPYFESDDYVFAVCLCPVTLNMGIKIKKDSNKNYQRFKCSACGMEGVMCYKLNKF